MKCPGQDTRYWKPGDIFEIKCPFCNKDIEFFKDDVKRKCDNCGSTIPNPKLDMGCLEWCKFAEQCAGPELLKKKIKNKR